MGRRSINTTKSGKYMNPTDQARKEARKKELKKNKRQRQLVRAAVLKGKDPLQLIQEMEKIDNMEYNVLQPSPLNEKVLKDKRRKLRETLDRVLKMYIKEDPEKWEELKRAEAEYEKRRSTMATYSEAVRHAQQVQVDEIPLPIRENQENLLALGITSQIPLPDMTLLIPPTSILRKRSAYSPPRNKVPPGVPPGPPPELSSDEEDPEMTEEKSKVRTIRFADSDSEGEEPSGKETGPKLMEMVKPLDRESFVGPVPPPPGMPPLAPPMPPPLGGMLMRPPGPPPGLPPRLLGIRIPVSSRALECVPGSSYMKDCNRCHCTLQGREACTRALCLKDFYPDTGSRSRYDYAHYRHKHPITLKPPNKRSRSMLW